MSATDTAAIISAIAWPAVALIIFLVLHPLIKSNFLKLISALQDIKQIPSDFQKANSEFVFISDSIKRQLAELQSVGFDINQLKNKANEINENVSEIIEERDERNLNLLKPETTLGYVSDIKDFDLSLQNLKDIWDKFESDFIDVAQNLGISTSRNAIDDTAYRLSHGRRKNSLTKSEADLIAELFSINRSMRRIKRPAETWLTDEYINNFTNKIQTARTAIERLKK